MIQLKGKKMEINKMVSLKVSNLEKNKMIHLEINKMIQLKGKQPGNKQDDTA